jgi:hypothetical protein
VRCGHARNVGTSWLHRPKMGTQRVRIPPGSRRFRRGFVIALRPVVYFLSLSLVGTISCRAIETIGHTAFNDIQGGDPRARWMLTAMR